VPTDKEDNTRPDLMDPALTWKPARTVPKPDRTAYQAVRWAELDRIRGLDLAYRRPLSYIRPAGSRGNDGRQDGDGLSSQVGQERNKAEHELHLCRRVLVHAVEGYLLGGAEYPELTGEAALGRATGTESLIDLLQAEENLMI
jgi:hypothetical protein